MIELCDTGSVSNKSKSQPKFKTILKVIDLPINDIQAFLTRYQLHLNLVKSNHTIPGSFWGESEAGLTGDTLHVRDDTPIHSLLHETCHFICMDQHRRSKLNTNAEGDFEEENAVCYLQILLANEFPKMTSERMMYDMDSWGYTFRLGSAKAWFENDSEDALLWLQDKQLVDTSNQPNYTLRIK